ncbi:TauD/TfdA family dioxygenase [Streptomyces sp. DG2A-72]|uniref:TauD/TfdA family dioxygenase n=1 Tax=Streptomyces sp. DG2A-72 TaxID=3051386 RepID=UPI00265BE220|nr:TauD/TfdA family dioxygenase [Streptomyces sp. DG2A-72]MDO0933577.1 TauD/TfdA family dioxygenase [Streptomyces sp. DG2A-72]
MSTLPVSSLNLSEHLETNLIGPRLLKYLNALLDANGYVYVHGAPERYDYLGLLGRLGEFVPQYDGSLVWDLKPEPGMDGVYHSKNTQPLVPHTEAYEFAGDPPRFLALWGVKQAEGQGGETTLADGYRFLAGLSDAQLAELRARSYNWHSSEGLSMKGIHVNSTHPSLETRNGQTILRYSYNNVTKTGDGVLENYLEEGKKYFDAEHFAVSIETNCLLVWDNWRMIHSRNAFTDRSRHLKRVLIR